ncbi:xanthine dehydrogenase family protein molybdopterin-binding subunit [Corticibacter populi]|uniref:Xanthine dehydrogenase family protein molybdopterin-binding subunit n=1 Tax=Corticibacter populi TaxID=1550736 RepID=A0A3M6QSL9_9BURK|nr:molybdopterin cofactor-binding domain-containing protein [Corticibacter populi]RMX06025.1 xanthine dehydrogenase family protein molybdopterin-binding subunit [Corticibacter populi]
MSMPVEPRALRDALLARSGALLIVRNPTGVAKPAPGQPGSASDYVPDVPDIFIAVLDDGRVCAFNGHVDLGTGIRTALAQIVAEELETDVRRLMMVLGHTEGTPNQGPTIASASIQISAVPLRRAAAQAREHLIGLAAQHWGCSRDGLQAREDAVIDAQHGRRLSYGELLRGRKDVLYLADEVPLKPSSAYRIVGQAAARVDIPAKATGRLTFVHDVRVPGMRHGRVVRPPYHGRDSGGFVGRSLLEVDAGSVAALPGHVQVVVDGDFVGVVADREEQAEAAMRALKVRWAPPPSAPDLSDLAQALRAHPSTPRPLLQVGDVQAALPGAAKVLRNTYVWPYQMHGSIGPSCAVAAWQDGRLTVWSGTQNPHMLRTDLDRLLEVGEQHIEIVRMEASGCYGRNCADDVCADAAILSRAVGAPVRVQLTRAQEHLWEPKGTAQLMETVGAIDHAGQLLAYDIAIRYPSNDAPLLALLLTGRIPAEPRALEMGDRTAVPPYRYPHLTTLCHDTPPIVRSSWLRGVSALPNSFAHDSMVDELCEAAGADRLAFRLRHLDDLRAIELLQATARRAGWVAGATGSRGEAGDDGLLHGRGIAYARYIHSKFPGFGAAWGAWVADLTVDPRTGKIRVERVTYGQDTGMVVNPSGVRHQIHGNIVQSLSRVLLERVAFDETGVASREWGAYPILGFCDLPEIDLVLMDRQDQPPMGAGESASVPSAAAIANALFDATGLRFRAPPFTPDVVLKALRAQAEQAEAASCAAI